MTSSRVNPQSNARAEKAKLAFLGGFSDELEKIAFAASNMGTFKPPTIKPKINPISQPTPHTLETQGDFTSGLKSTPPPPVVI